MAGAWHRPAAFMHPRGQVKFAYQLEKVTTGEADGWNSGCHSSPLTRHFPLAPQAIPLSRHFPLAPQPIPLTRHLFPQIPPMMQGVKFAYQLEKLAIAEADGWRRARAGLGQPKLRGKSRSDPRHAIGPLRANL